MFFYKQQSFINTQQRGHRDDQTLRTWKKLEPKSRPKESEKEKKIHPTIN